MSEVPPSSTPPTTMEPEALEIKIPTYRVGLFKMLNVVRYPTFCYNVDALNGFPISRVELNKAWDSMIEQKWNEYNQGFLGRRYPSEQHHYLEYLLDRASYQKWNLLAEKYWAKKEEKYGMKLPALRPEGMLNVNGRTIGPREFCTCWISEVEATDEARWRDERNQSNVELENEKARLAGLELVRGFADDEGENENDGLVQKERIEEAEELGGGDIMEGIIEGEAEKPTWQLDLVFRGAN